MGTNSKASNYWTTNSHRLHAHARRNPKKSIGTYLPGLEVSWMF